MTTPDGREKRVAVYSDWAGQHHIWWCDPLLPLYQFLLFDELEALKEERHGAV